MLLWCPDKFNLSLLTGKNRSMNYFSNCPRGLKGQCRIYLHILIYEIFTVGTLSLRQNIPYNIFLKSRQAILHLSAIIKKQMLQSQLLRGSTFPSNSSQTLKR